MQQMNSDNHQPATYALEMETMRKYTSAYLKGNCPPFSFTYGGKSSHDFLPEWQVLETSKVLDAKRTEYMTTYIDPVTKLSVRCVTVEYNDFPVIEWTLHFKNTGSTNTPIIENIQPLNVHMDQKYFYKNTIDQHSQKNALLHYNIGSPTSNEDFRPLCKELTPGNKERITTSGGRSCNKHMPYFNLEWGESGVIMVIGWPGQWAAEFARTNDNRIHLSAGQENTSFKLYPEEEVRSPLIALQFYHGNLVRGQNIWRRWMVAFNMPKPGGELPKPIISAMAILYSVPMGITNALADKIFIDTYEAKKIPLDCWWIDAGWYMCDFPENEDQSNKEYPTGMGPGEPSWPNTGTWQADPHRFPHGVQAVNRHAHVMNLKTILWFEPERVRLGLKLAEEHPEWLLSAPPNPVDQKYHNNDRLLDLGNLDALKWITNLLDKFIARDEIDIYREDFNMDPLCFWRSNEKKDRKGILEIKHVTNHLALWDELLRRHPDLLIDNCASGGKRLDLESIRRSISLWRSDYVGTMYGADATEANQCITYGLASWIPYFGSGVYGILNEYSFRSYMGSSFVLDCDPRSDYFDAKLCRKLFKQFKNTAKYYLGDYYPLTDYSLENDVWMAWQFNCPETGEGMIQAFRRKNNSCEDNVFILHGLNTESIYSVTDIDSEVEQQVSGESLMKKGVSVKISHKPGASVIIYKCKEKRKR
jgi:alpha-galactosidase